MKVYVLICGYSGLIEDVSVWPTAEQAVKARSKYLGVDETEFVRLLEEENEYMEKYEPTNIFECELEGTNIFVCELEEAPMEHPSE